MRKDRMDNGYVVIEKPWGAYTDIYRTPTTVFKQINLKPGGAISYQFHKEREEFWYISSGQGIMKINEEEVYAKAGDTFYMNKMDRHMIENTGDLMLTIMEMQCGQCREDDIVRLEDKYGR